MTHEAELRRQATAAGVFLELLHRWRCSDCGRPTGEPREVNGVSVLPPCAFCLCDHGQLAAVIRGPSLTSDEAEQLLVWLDRWQSRRRRTVGRPDENEGHETALFELVKPMNVQGWVWCEAAPGDPNAWPLPIVRPLLDPPAGFELVRKSWCPRCDRDGDPLGKRTIGHWVTYGRRTYNRGPLRANPVRIRPRCEVVPPAPEREIGQLCGRQVPAPPEDCEHYTITGVDGSTLTLDSGDEMPNPPVAQAYTNTITCSNGSFIGDGYHVGDSISITETRPCRCRRLYRWGLRRELSADQAIDDALFEIDWLQREAEAL